MAARHLVGRSEIVGLVVLGLFAFGTVALLRGTSRPLNDVTPVQRLNSSVHQAAAPSVELMWNSAKEQGGRPDAHARSGYTTESQHESVFTEQVQKILAPDYPIRVDSAELRVLLKHDDLPSLYAALEIPQYVDRRNLILHAISLLEEPGVVLNLIKKHISTYDNYSAYPDELFSFGRGPDVVPFDRIGAVTVLSRLPKEIGGPWMSYAFTEKGAMDILQKWNGQVYPCESTFATYVHFLSYCAALGLAELQDSETFECVENEYFRIKNIPEKERTVQETRRLGACIEAMARRDFIAREGMAEYHRWGAMGSDFFVPRVFHYMAP
ncbi:MAG: hypothetical protein QG656_2291, partial [Candidatus Hydrogenedentes bacterium]|nr:hypothetical protein [Candidatus Hydrogenedentota bacterium]